MLRTLYLLRHGQSAEKQTGRPDKERELTHVGVKDVMLVGDYIKKQNLPVDIIICSSAERTKSTARYLIDAIKFNSDKIVEEDELYEASLRTFLELISKLDDEYHHVLFVGHNPGISYLAEYLSKAEIGDMYTAGLVIIKFRINSWQEAAKGNGELENYVYPEMLDTN